MSDFRDRAPAGVPSGGQFVTSARDESQGVSLSTAHDRALARIVDAEAREACAEYATRYAPGPTDPEAVTDWTGLTGFTKPASDLAIGDRMPTNQVITAVDQTPAGSVFVYCDGRPAAGTSDYAYSHYDLATVHRDRVDLSDPDWYAVETARAVAQRIADEEAQALDTDFVLPDERREEIRTEVLRGMTRCMQPTNHSPLFHDGPDADPRIPNGRAKVGDSVIFSQPMHGDSAYEVLGKRAQRTITGHDGASVTWGENGDVEYVLRSITTGHQTTSNLRGAGWRRIPAPGDQGAGAKVLASTR